MSNQGKRPDEVEFNTTVGKNIRYLRKLKKLTQTKVGDAIGVSFQQVQKYEKGSNGLHSYSLYKVAHRVFNVSMDLLADPKMITKYEGFKEEAFEHNMGGVYAYWENEDDELDRADGWIKKNPKEAEKILGEAKRNPEVGGKEPPPTEAGARKAAEQVYERLKPKVI